MEIAYTIGNRKSYDKSFEDLKNGLIPEMKKIGRCGSGSEYYPGGCCWKTIKEAKEYIGHNKDKIPYEPKIYGIKLPNGWELDTSHDTIKEGYSSLLVDADLFEVSDEDSSV